MVEGLGTVVTLKTVSVTTPKLVIVIAMVVLVGITIARRLIVIT